MTLKSMTGFSRSAGAASPYRWAWEVKTVNAKGLDLRLRLPPGFESLEPEVRSRLSRKLARGACQAGLALQRDAGASEVRVDLAAIAAIRDALSKIDATGFGPLSLDGLLSVRGVVDVVDRADEDRAGIEQALLVGLDEAIEGLATTRAEEGAALSCVLADRLTRLAQLVEAADAAPGRRPEAMRARLVRMIEELEGRAAAFDADRLRQEALLLASKADVTEEIDRLRTHVVAARTLLSSDAPVGRRLDFLSQELGREAATLCAKSNDGALTTIGIELRVEIEQFREQVQNIE